MSFKLTALAFLIAGSIIPALGATATGQPFSPQVSTTQYGDWVLRCMPQQAAALPCDIVQSLAQKDSKAQVLTISMAYSAKDNRHAIEIGVPLGIDLRRGVDISVGSVTARHVHPTRCEINGCIIDALIADDMLEALAKNDKGRVIVSADGKKDLAIEFSLKGYNDAEAALRHEAEARKAQ